MVFSPPVDHLTRFVVAETGCWTWTGPVGTSGYGNASRGPAHRVFYEAHRGPIPRGTELDHLCRNRICVNPDHLEIVTRKVNQRRGDGFIGVNHRKAACLRGHVFSETNAYIDSRGWRVCRVCPRERWRASKSGQPPK